MQAGHALMLNYGVWDMPPTVFLAYFQIYTYLSSLAPSFCVKHMA